MRQLSHPNIVQILGVVLDHKGLAVALLMELADYGSLRDAMDDHPLRSSPQTSRCSSRSRCMLRRAWRTYTRRIRQSSITISNRQNVLLFAAATTTSTADAANAALTARNPGGITARSPGKYSARNYGGNFSARSPGSGKFSARSRCWKPLRHHNLPNRLSKDSTSTPSCTSTRSSATAASRPASMSAPERPYCNRPNRKAAALSRTRLLRPLATSTSRRLRSMHTALYCGSSSLARCRGFECKIGQAVYAGDADARGLWGRAAAAA